MNKPYQTASGLSTLLPNGKLRKSKKVVHDLYQGKLPYALGPVACAPIVKGEQGPLPLGLLPVRNVTHAEHGENPAVLPLVFSRKDFAFDSDEPRFWSKQESDFYRRKAVPVCDALSKITPARRSGFTFNLFGSGELTGARFTTGTESKPAMVSRSGSIETDALTQPARTKIRRAIQNADDTFRCFMTVTFSPAHLHPWQMDENGCVRHDYAKYKFKKFLNTIRTAYDRKAKASKRCSDRISYVWVAEIQHESTGNIHFHVLVNHRIPIKWLTKLWDQASNSIDVRTISNLNHASCYIRKYMAKDKSKIQGNRYGITQGLRESMKPTKTVYTGDNVPSSVFSVVRGMSSVITENGGKVLDHGFYLPVPCRSVVYRNRQGHRQETKSVSWQVASRIMLEADQLLSESLPF